MYSIVATLLECTTPKICFLIGASRTFKTLCKVRKLQQPLRLCMESSGDSSRSMCVHRLSFMHQSGPHFISPRYRNRISCSCCATWKPTPLLAPVTTSRSTASVWGKRGICDLDKRSLVSRCRFKCWASKQLMGQSLQGRTAQPSPKAAKGAGFSCRINPPCCKDWAMLWLLLR